MKQRLIFSLASALLLGGVMWISWPTKKTLAPTKATNTSAAVNVAADVDLPTNVASNLIEFSTADLPDRDPAFSFNASIPSTWRVEYVPSSQAINIYDPQLPGNASLEKSTIFIKYFTAASFLTLATVDIKSQSDSIINGHPARTYVIEKKPEAANFTGQPAWRNLEHQVTDIRTTDENPTVFYVIAKAPSLSEAQFSAWLSSLSFTSAQ